MTRRRDPNINSSTREGRMLKATRLELDRRIGPTPSFEARELADQILRAKREIALVERKRIDAGALSEIERELMMRHENALSRALRRLERLAPLPASREPSLADLLAADRAAREAQAA